MINLQSKSKGKSQLLAIAFPTPPYCQTWVLFSGSYVKENQVLSVQSAPPREEGVLESSSKTLPHAADCPAFLCLPGHIPFSWLLQTERSLLPHPSVSLFLCDCQVRDRGTDFLPIGYIRKPPMRPFPGCIGKPPKESHTPSPVWS